MLKKLRALLYVFAFFFRLFITWLRDDVIGWQEARKRKQNVYLQGNFAPIHDELDFEFPSKNAKIPDDFPAGIYVRNGPNPRYTPKHNLHWFEGDGHLHAVQINSDRTVSYRNKFIRTLKYKIEDDFQGQVTQGFIDSANPFTQITRYYRHKIRGALGIADTNTANTALKVFNNKFLALVEGSLPTEIKLPSLETVGSTDFDGELKHHMTAHPIFDPKTKELIYFGYKMFDSPAIQYSIISEEGKRKLYYAFKDNEVPWKTMHHSFAVTENYTIFMFFPLICDKMQVGKGMKPVQFCNDVPSKYAVIPRYFDPSKDKIRWFEGTSGYCFHIANAFEEDGDIVIQYCIGQNFNLDLDFSSNTYFKPTLSEIRFNLENNTVKENKLLFRLKDSDEAPVELNAEFPLIHDDYVCQKHRYVYMGGFASHSILMESVIKVDMETMTYEKIELGSHRFAGEWVFVPKTGAKKEDDGYLCAFVHDEKDNVTTFEIADAHNMNVVSSLKLPRRVPYGFHGLFVTEEQMKQLK